MSENELSLFAFSSFVLLEEVVVLLLQDFLFSLKLSSHVINLSITVGLGSLKLVLEAVTLFLDPLQSFLEATSFRHHGLVGDFKSLVDSLVLLLKTSYV
jgi:hypothetical protein